MKGIVSQSSDNQYWDIWNCQKLSPEFEVKRQIILKANQVSVSNILTNLFVCMTSEENNKSFVIQNLTNQLVELERHFNNLEMNRSSETGRVASNRRAVYSNKTRSRYLTVRPFCYKFYIHLWCVWFVEFTPCFMR